jgi:hypothetical protein
MPGILESSALPPTRGGGGMPAAAIRFGHTGCAGDPLRQRHVGEGGGGGGGG